MLRSDSTRFIGLCVGDSHFAASDPSPEDMLPIDDQIWFEGVNTYLACVFTSDVIE